MAVHKVRDRIHITQNAGVRLLLQSGRRGFTLIEIMIIVAIIGLLAAFAIPYLMRARMNANESAVKADMKTFWSSCESFRAAQNASVYPTDIAALTVAGPPYLDNSWAEGGNKHGFVLNYLAAANTFSLLATPSSSATINTFCIDQTGVLSGSTVDGTATVPTATAEGCANGTPITV